MKKSIVAIAVVAAAVVVGAPYLTGSLAESETRKMVDGFNQKPDEYGTTSIVSYERGYRSSKVSYEYQLPTALAAFAGSKQAYKYDCDYVHGMASVDFDCNIRANEAYKKFIDDNFAGDDPLQITGDMSAFGGLSQEIALKNISQTLKDGTTLKFSPSKIVVESDAKLSVFDSTANFGELEISSKDGALNMGASSMDWTLKPTDLGLFEGDYSLSAGDISFVDQQQNTTIQGLNISGTSVERGDKMDSTMVMKVQSFDAKGQAGVALEDVTIAADVLGLNSEALVEYQNFAASMQAEVMAGLEKSGEPEIDPNLMLELLPIIEKMLDKNLNIKLALSGKLMGKPNSMDIDLKLLEKTSFTQLSAFMFNPESVLQNMDIKLNSSLNKELIQSHPMAGPMIGSSPLFADDGDNFEAKIKLGAESQVNGKKVTFEELQGMVMSSMM